MHGNHQRTSSRPVGANVHAPAQVSHDLGVSNWTVQSHTAQGPHQGDASRDSHRSATRGHCQCAPECCRGSLGHVDVAPAARGLRLGRAGRPGHAGRTRAPPRPRGCHAGRTRAPPRPRGCHASRAWAAPHAGAADHERRLRASCQTVGIAAECVVTVRIISSLRVSVALILCG